MSNLQPHQQRVVNERDELVDRMAKLYGFINGGGPAFNQLDNAEQYRLRRQLGHMTSYAEVLDERIAAFQSAPVPTFAENSLPYSKSDDAEATHKCTVCGAFWRFWPKSEAGLEQDTWSLKSASCGKCCDNAVMGDQIVPLAADEPFHPGNTINS